MIPKIIHYCWMSHDPYPEDIQMCIDSWKKCMPDYEIRLWNADTFDVNSYQYTKEAFSTEKYAYVSDVIRLYALYNYGGIYLDSDILVKKSFDDLLFCEGFTGFEAGERIGAWIFASQEKNPIFGELMEYYDGLKFIDIEGRPQLIPNTIPVTKTLIKHGLRPVNEVQVLEHITVFPEDYFCPYNPWTGEEIITPDTHAKHLFAGGWNNKAGNDLPFVRKIPENVDIFLNYADEDDKQDRKIIVYGAGVVGKFVLKELLKRGLRDRIDCVAVTYYDNDWRESNGIPVKMINEVTDKTDLVLISTIPQYHSEIQETLHDKGFRDIVKLGE